jgi:hypothetical protein
MMLVGGGMRVALSYYSLTAQRKLATPLQSYRYRKPFIFCTDDLQHTL